MAPNLPVHTPIVLYATRFMAFCNLNSLVAVTRAILLIGTIGSCLFPSRSVMAGSLPNGWGELSSDQAKMINYGVFSGQIFMACTFADFGHVSKEEARKAIKATLDLSVARYGQMFAKAVGWNVRRTFSRECSPVWPAGYLQYFPDKPFPVK
jgi:hypothetical protein